MEQKDLITAELSGDELSEDKIREKNQVFKILFKLSDLLQESHHGHRSDKIKEAIDLLEQTRMVRKASFFWSNDEYMTLGNLKKNDGKAVLLSPEPESSQSKQPAVSVEVGSDNHKILDKLHQELLQTYHYSIWSYPFPANENNEIMNNTIGEWQNDMMASASSSSIPFATLLDFQRNVNIAGESYTNKPEVEIENALKALINEVEKDEKNAELYLSFLKANGGQASFSFISLMLHHGEMGGVIDRELKDTGSAAAIGLSNALLQNWSIENGKICFNYVMQVNSITLGDQGSVFSLGKEAPQFSKTENLIELKEQGKLSSLQPLMSINMRMELDIIDNKVCPKVKELDILCHKEIKTKEYTFTSSTLPALEEQKAATQII